MADHQHQSAEIEWTGGALPVSKRFGDPYYSANGGLLETDHVFLAGNRLPERFAPGFRIAELGFGSGLNMLAAWRSWRRSGQTGDLDYTSFEAFPMNVGDMTRALQAFSELSSLSEPFLAAWRSGATRFRLDGLSAEIVLGDARATLRHWRRQADAWFLDGFAPAKNPELWSPELLAMVADRTRANGTFATYSAAGHVRRALGDAGFEVERRKGYGRKRHMTTGVLKGAR